MFGLSTEERFFESWLTFEVLLPGGTLCTVIEDPAVRVILTDLVGKSLAHNKQDVCCVTGAFGDVAKTHFKVKGVPLSRSGQSSLVSFNAPAFRAYGMSDGDDGELSAPVSVQAMIAYTGALNWLLGPGGRDNRRNIGDTAFLFWGGNGCVEQIGEVLNEPSDPKTQAKAEKKKAKAEGEAKKIFESPFTGVVTERTAQVNVLGITAAQARASIAYWRPGSAHDVSRNVLKWVDDIGWGGGLAWGESTGDLPWRPTVGRLTRLILNKDKGTGESAERARGRVSRALAACAFENVRVPAEIACHVARLIVCGDWKGGSRNGDLTTLTGLLGAYEIRQRNTTKELIVANNMYILGRFYSLVEKAEIDSLRARGSKIASAPVTRMKKAIYTRPRWGLQQLDERFEIALKRLRPEGQIYYRKLRNDMADMTAEPFPPTSVDGNLFLIGALHESRKLWAPKEQDSDERVRKSELFA